MKRSPSWNVFNSAIEKFREIFGAVEAQNVHPQEIAISSLTGSSDAFLALSLASNHLVFVVTPGIPHCERLVDDLNLLAADTSTRILEFPVLIPEDRSSLGSRIKTLSYLRTRPKNESAVIVAPFAALASPVPTYIEPLELTAGSIQFSELVDKLAKWGFRRLSQVENEGDYSVRGGIVDVWSPGEEFPVRIEFFGDDVESLRSFNPATQTSIAPLSHTTILPSSSTSSSSSSSTSTSSSSSTSTSTSTSIFNLLPTDTQIIALEHNEYNLQPFNPSTLQPFNPSTLYTGDPAPFGVITKKFQTVPLPGFAELGASDAHHPELFEAARKRLKQHLQAAKKRGLMVVECDELSGGFEIGDLIVVTKSDRVFAKKHYHPRSSSNAALMSGKRIDDFDELEPGEYVVHLDYGVGRYIGSKQLVDADGNKSEVFTIEYADGAKLHIPAVHAHLLSRYVGVRGEEVRLHRLDGKRWAQDKKNAQAAVSDLAAALLETQAKRDTVPGYAYDTCCEGAEAFDAAFPYDETPDQAAAIEAVKRDLAGRKPMDRLICGDAGYGKTEVAMRAAFIAAMNGKQVAVLAPTTVLAEQHFETFTSRFDGTPIRIEPVSRFQTRLTHQGTFQRIASGACDIVIGTHAILSPNIVFHDLGLIIIDEEQRFGVRHKEFLKKLRATADVLTLSATPIPRTLYLSMTGARDLSLLRSPPRERVAVETKIVRDSDDVIRSAIAAELMRGGQVFFLHNRVHTISGVEKRLKEICPRAKIVVAHGQMDARTLAAKMRDFEHGKYDILLSTTIVESGIDIPRANTILVADAHTFGMADLYQLRGRVGRSSKQGFAYFLLPPSGIIDSEARERLDALKRHGGLGSGFNLAVRDLELRGAGNLLGSQQSGHIAAVGFSLYCQLLQRTIALMKGQKVREVVDTHLNLDFVTPCLSYEYIQDDTQRLKLLKRFAEAQDVKQIKALAVEMKDRFGPLPDEVKLFVKAAELRVIAAQNLITNIDVRGNRAVFYKAGSRDVAFVRDLTAPTIERKLKELIELTTNH